MARINNLENFLQDVADAIKEKKEYQASQKIAAEDFDTEISSISTLKGEQITITPSTSQQIITPTQGKNAITQATVNAVTAAIDSDIQSGNIKNGVDILGVTGELSNLTQTDYEALETTLDTIMYGDQSDPVFDKELYEVRAYNSAVNLEYIPNSTTTFEIQYYHNAIEKLECNSGVLFGTRQNDNTNSNSQRCYLLATGVNSRYVGFHVNNFYTSDDKYISTSSGSEGIGGTNMYVTVSSNGKNATLSAVSTSYTKDITISRNVAPTQCYGPLALFGCNVTSSNTFSPNNYESLCVRYLKIFESGVLKHHYVGAIDSKGTICIYDKIDQKLFYPNRGILLGGSVVS